MPVAPPVAHLELFMNSPAARSSITVQAKRARPPNLALSPPPKRSATAPSVLDLDTPIDDIDNHPVHHKFTPPTSPLYATPLSAAFSPCSHSETDSDHLKSPEDISNQLAVLEQLRRSVQKNLRLRPISLTPSPPRSPTHPLSSASIWSTQAPSSSPASTIASPSIYYTPISDPKSPLTAHFIGPSAFDRPAQELPRSPARSIDPASLAARLENSPRRPLLIDTRPAAAFLGCHIKSSINFAIPSLILKRSRKPGAGFGSIDALRQFITTDPCRIVWDSLMAPGGSWDGGVIVYDEEMNPQDRLNAQVIAWALLPIISPLLVRGRADYLEGGMLAACSHPDLKKFIASPHDSSLETLDQMQEGEHHVLASPPPPPKLSFPFKPKKNGSGGLFQLDTATAARSRTLPEIEFSAGASPVQMLANILPGNTETSPWNIADASPSPPPSQSVFPRPPSRKASLTALRKLDTKSAERLGPPKLHVRTVRSATLAAPPSTGLWPNGASSPRAHSPSHLTLTHSNHTSPASARHGDSLLPPPSPNIPSSPRTPVPPSPCTVRPDMSTPPSTEEAIPAFTVSTILPNFLYLGPEITAEEHARELESLGVRRILNIAAECDDDHGLGLRQRFERYVKIPMRDTVEEENIIHGVREACEALDDASLHSAPTYVHCKAGKSRSVTAVMAYLIHANHWTLSRAYTFVLERRKGISPNIGFVSELMNFEETELGNKSVGVVKQPQSAGGGGCDNDHTDADGNLRSGGINGRRPSHMRESLPPAWGSGGSASGALSTVPRGVAGDVGQETEVKDASGRYRHARRAPVDENTLQPMRRVSKAGLESTST
ncbi:hypothetical protein F5148DRAFT_33946 [Russula earlei]|uniref:Uncharacterized protein n=1 Tax=Russula earlei TaxID=71964 RepID=A0ACC0U9K6_9AGAM|nr:hypothetical protein F5148DRAFT_33946 [Russula earlei]